MVRKGSAQEKTGEGLAILASDLSLEPDSATKGVAGGHPSQPSQLGPGLAQPTKYEKGLR